MEGDLKNPHQKYDEIGSLIGNYTIVCKKCKNIEDTFTDNEKPEDFDWFFHRNKWYCPSCSHLYKVNMK